MLVVTDRRKLTSTLPIPTHSKYSTADVWQITGIDLIPLSPSRSHLSMDQKLAEDETLDAVRAVFRQDLFYYSTHIDLTRSFQLQQLQANNKMGQHPNGTNTHAVLWKGADERFWWNRHLQRKLIEQSQSDPDQDLSAFILPIISGFVEFHTFDGKSSSSSSATLGNTHVGSWTMGLISRRGVGRVGTRYFSRGIDQQGNVSNFVETEQILYTHTAPPSGAGGAANRLDGNLHAHVQIRGSIPVFWQQQVNVKYKPRLALYGYANTVPSGAMLDSKVEEKQQHQHPIDLASDDDLLRLKELTTQAVQKHFSQLKTYYGEVICWNLVDTKGDELRLARAMQDQLSQLQLSGGDGAQSFVKYEHFDFHKECSKMRWDRIRLLLDKFETELSEQGYFSFDFAQGKVEKWQKSVVRTNCIDCLDRTNVVQSEVAKRVLTEQLRFMGVFAPGQTLSLDDVPSREVTQVFKNLWADHADAISLQYSGTGALKTDFTRTGRRTQLGALSDLSNSIIRYVKNNYLDGSRQDALDLLLGRYEIGPGRSGVPPGYGSGRDVSWVWMGLMMGLVVGMGMLLLTLLGMVTGTRFYSSTTTTTTPSETEMNTGDASSSNPTDTLLNQTWWQYLSQSILFWLCVVLVDVQLIIRNGKEFVRLPRLIDPYAPPPSLNMGGSGMGVGMGRLSSGGYMGMSVGSLGQQKVVSASKRE